MRLVVLLAASVLAHGVAFAAFGHLHGAKGPAREAVQTLEIDAPEIVEAPEAPIPEAPKATLENEIAHEAHAFPTHTHDYPVPASHDATPHDPSLVHMPLAQAHDHDHDTHDEDHDDHAHDAPPVIEAAPSTTPHFAMALGGGVGSGAVGGGSSQGTGATTGAATASSDDDASSHGPIAENAVDERAHLVASTSPAYPAEAAAAEIESKVTLEIVVDASGNVTAARSLSHAGYGLDEAAVRGVRAYRFAPAKRHGHAVAVRMKWVVEFRLS